jgi:hypothetical protein
MRIPRHWARQAGEAVTPSGKRIPFSTWQGSELSPEEAQARARETAQRIADRIRMGEDFRDRYAYGERPLREEIVEEIGRSAGGEMEAAITRNVYGALVLNTARACFIDVDLPRPSKPNPLAALARKLVRRPLPLPPDHAAAALDRLRAWVDDHPGWSVRVYRTHSGLRYLATHAPLAPGEGESEEAMRFLGADPRYVQLCRAQRSFRARLTPKPWRIDTGLPPVRFPYEDGETERAMRRWSQTYAENGRGHATCRLIEVVGDPHAHPDIDPLMRVHDRHTRASSDLPLA